MNSANNTYALIKEKKTASEKEQGERHGSVWREELERKIKMTKEQ